MTLQLVMLQSVVAPIESVTAASLMGWAAFIFGLGTFGILVWDRVIGKGKSLAGVSGKIDKLCEHVEEIEVTQKLMDAHLESVDQAVRGLSYEWSGVSGVNGAKALLREHSAQLTKINDRNTKRDAVIEEDRRRSGGQHRRAIDRVVDEEGAGG